MAEATLERLRQAFSDAQLARCGKIWENELGRAVDQSLADDHIGDIHGTMISDDIVELYARDWAVILLPNELTEGLRAAHNLEDPVRMACAMTAALYVKALDEGLASATLWKLTHG